MKKPLPEEHDLLPLSAWILAFILTFGNGTVLADDDSRRARELYEAGEIVSLETIIEHANRIHTGRILEAELEEEDGMLVYEIEILTKEGVVWELYFDARNGELLKKELED